MTAEEYARVFLEIPEPAAKTLWVQDFHNMIVHTRGGHSEKLIATRRPNEEETTRQYRLNNDRAITRDAFMKAITNLQRILSHSAVEIIYPDRLAEYLSGKNFKQSDLLTFFQRYVAKRMIEAANAFLVWWPENVGVLNERVTVVPIIVMPDQIHHYEAGEYLTWLTHEKTETGGRIWKSIVEDKLLIIREENRDSKVVIETEEYYNNPVGDIYALVLGGDEVSQRSEGTATTPPVETSYFTSYMSSALAFADECKVQFSDHQGVMVNCAFPLREVESMKCQSPDCSDGYLRYLDERGNRQRCGTCNGTGRMPMNTNPYGWLIRPDRKRGVNDTDTTDIPMIRFIHPDPSILEFGKKSWEDLLKKTENSLHLLFVDEAQSGIAKNIDREDKLAWLDKVALHFYKYLMANSIMIIHAFRHPGERMEEPKINLPSTFVIKNESVLIEDVGNLRKQGAPDFVIVESMREFVSKKFGGDPERMKIFDVLLFLDPFSTNNFEEKVRMVGTGAISDRDLRFSTIAPGILSSYIRQNPNFMQMSIEQIASEVRPLIEKVLNDEMIIRGQN